jgi:hypothetical protein
MVEGDLTMNWRIAGTAGDIGRAVVDEPLA